jgi:hypothetical protein
MPFVTVGAHYGGGWAMDGPRTRVFGLVAVASAYTTTARLTKASIERAEDRSARSTEGKRKRREPPRLRCIVGRLRLFSAGSPVRRPLG